MSMAIKYQMVKKAKKMAEGGVAKSCSCGQPGCPMCKGGMMAEGGLVDDDMVGRIMRKRLGSEPTADFEAADYDVLDEIPEEHSADYTGANSGDEIGNGQEDDDRHDIVSRIMRSRAKKDRLPRPA